MWLGFVRPKLKLEVLSFWASVIAPCSDMSAQRLLIADDNPDIIASGRFLFEPEDFEVIGVQSPQAVLEYEHQLGLTLNKHAVSVPNYN